MDRAASLLCGRCCLKLARGRGQESSRGVDKPARRGWQGFFVIAILLFSVDSSDSDVIAVDEIACLGDGDFLTSGSSSAGFIRASGDFEGTCTVQVLGMPGGQAGIVNIVLSGDPSLSSLSVYGASHRYWPGY